MPEIYLDNDQIIQQSSRLEKMGEGNIFRLLLEYSIPSIVMMVVGGLYNIVDAIFVGHGVGSDGLAALAVAMPLMIVQMSIGSIAGPGAGALIAIKLGEGDKEAAQKILGSAIVFAFLSGIIIILITLPFLDFWLRELGAKGNVFDLAKQFSLIVLSGSILSCLGYGLNPLIRNEGSPKISMWSTVTACVLNVFLNPILIFGFNMGIAGSAWATMFSFAVGCLWNWGYYFSRKSILKIRWIDIRWRWQLICDIAKIGISPFVMQILTSVVLLVCNSMVLKLADNTAVAIFGVCTRLQYFIVLPIIGMYLGAQPLIGYNYGAENYKRVLKILQKSMVAASVISLVGCVIMQVFAKQIMMLFSDDATVIGLGTEVLRMTMAMIWVVGPAIMASNFFMAINKAKYTIFFTSLRQGVILIPLIFILPHFLGIEGVWLAFPLMDFINIIIVMLFLYCEIGRMKARILNA